MEKTISEFDSIIKNCEDIFAKKMKDYGSAWRILRISSLTDQIFIKAQRIRSIEDKGLQKVDEGVISEFIGIVNYSIIGLIQLELGVAEQEEEIQYDQVMNLFDKYALKAKKLMMDKNHDYGEAWKDMRVSSLTDLILQKLWNPRLTILNRLILMDLIRFLHKHDEDRVKKYNFQMVQNLR